MDERQGDENAGQVLHVGENHLLLPANEISAHTLQLAQFYYERMAPLIKVGYRSYNTSFITACRKQGEDRYFNNLISRFLICEETDQEVYAGQPDDFETQLRLDEQAWNLKQERLHEAFGDDDYTATATIRMHNLTVFAAAFDHWYHHTRKENRDPERLKNSEAYSQLFDELMQHAGIQKVFLDQDPSLSERRLTEKADAIAEGMIADFTEALAAQDLEKKRLTINMKHQARFTRMMNEVGPIIHRMNTSLPLSAWYQELHAPLKEKGYSEKKIDDTLDDVVRAMVSQLEHMDNGPVALGSSELVRAMYASGADQYFDVKNLKIQAALVRCSSMMAHMLEYVQCAAAYQLDSSSAKGIWKTLNQHRRGLMESQLESACEQVTFTPSKPEGFAKNTITKWCKDVDAAVAKHAVRASSAGKERG